MKKLTGSAHFKLFPVVRMNCLWSRCKISLSGEQYSDAEYLCIGGRKGNDNRYMSPPIHSKGVALNSCRD